MFSINKINKLLLFLILLNNVFYYSIIFFNANLAEKISNYFVFWFIINIILIFLFFIFNIIYIKDLKDGKNTIKKLINLSGFNKENNKEFLSKKSKYKETEEIFDLFKNMYIRKNLLLKDYKDFQLLFSKLVSSKLIDKISEKGRDRITLGLSTKKKLNIMFIDIIWFTTIAEKLTSERSLFLLNIYFDWIVEIIEKNGGYIDKFLWDWMMVIFDGNFSDNTIKTSIEIQQFMKTFRISKLWKKISVGIGINSWEVILWTIWAKNRMEISVIWDIVNTASRIENLTRHYNENIIIGKNTYDSIKNKNDFNIVNLWIKNLKWKRKKIEIYWIKDILLEEVDFF